MVTSFTDWDSGLYLAHHGIKGQKWGVRRYQNPDGTLTELGKRRQQKDAYKSMKASAKESRSYKELLEKNKKLLPEDKMKELYNISQKGAKKLEKMTKGRETEDSDIEEAYSEYYDARDKIVSDILGKYERKKTVLGGDSAGRNLREALSYVQDELRENGGKTSKEVADEKAFSSFQKGLKSGKSVADLMKGSDGTFDYDKLDSVYNHIEKKQSKLIDEWWKKKTSGSWRSQQTMQSFDAEAMRYAKQAAKNMGLPANKETLYFLLSWFFNGDD